MLFELADVPPASLYRHVARLVDASVLTVVGERRVRGAVERTYVLRVADASINIDEVERMSRDDHRQAFIAFVAGLLGCAASTIGSRPSTATSTSQARPARARR